MFSALLSNHIQNLKTISREYLENVCLWYVFALEPFKFFQQGKILLFWKVWNNIDFAKGSYDLGQTHGSVRWRIYS